MSKFGPSTLVDSSESKFGPSTLVEEDKEIPESLSGVLDPDRAIGKRTASGLELASDVLSSVSVEDIDAALRKIPGAASLAELAAGANRTVVDFIDFIGPDQVNSILEISGSERRVPTLREALPFIESGPLEPGLQKEVLGAAGEAIPLAAGIGGALRGAASKLPAFTAGETAGTGVARQLTAGAAEAPAGVIGADVGLGAAGGGGAVIGGKEGGQVGEAVGSILSPLAVTAVPKLITGVIRQGVKGIQSLIGDLSKLSEKGASTLLAEQMVREGLTPDDIVKQVADLGPNAIPADLGNNFARLLRTASNMIPRIEREAARTLDARQKGQSKRIAEAFDDASGTSQLNVNDEIVRLNDALKPQINASYAAARARSDEVFAQKEIPVILGGSGKGAAPSTPSATLETVKSGFSKFGGVGAALGVGAKKEIKLPTGVGAAKGRDQPARKVKVVEPAQTRLQALLSGKGVAGSKVKSKVDLEIKAKTLSGEKVTSLDVIDATKRALDDEIQKSIREGSTNKSRSLVILKNTLIDEVDKVIPEYKAARDLFSGKASLENASEQGDLFLKMKPRDIQQLTKSMSESEKRFYKLGAKQAILDKIDTLPINADSVKRLFGKQGDVQKLKVIFDDDAAFNKFSDTLEKEATFALTRRAAQANSTTIKQAADIGSAREALDAARTAIINPVLGSERFGQILFGLSAKKDDEIFTRSLEQAGDILLESGMNQTKLLKILRNANRDEVRKALEGVMTQVPSKIVAPVGQAAIAGELSQTQIQSQQ